MFWKSGLAGNEWELLWNVLVQSHFKVLPLKIGSRHLLTRFITDSAWNSELWLHYFRGRYEENSWRRKAGTLLTKERGKKKPSADMTRRHCSIVFNSSANLSFSSLFLYCFPHVFVLNCSGLTQKKSIWSSLKAEVWHLRRVLSLPAAPHKRGCCPKTIFLNNSNKTKMWFECFNTNLQLNEQSHFLNQKLPMQTLQNDD